MEAVDPEVHKVMEQVVEVEVDQVCQVVEVLVVVDHACLEVEALVEVVLVEALSWEVKVDQSES